MNNLAVIEKGIIPVYRGENGQLINARELHSFLEVGTKFTDWIKDRIRKYGFVENEDFIHVSEKRETSTGATIAEEYILTLDMAKEISMVQNNEKGGEARKYFIAVEKKFKEIVKPQCIEDLIIMQAQSLKDIRLQLEEAKQQAAAVKQEVQDIRDVVTISASNNWREDTNKMISKICKQLNDYQKPKDEIYKALEQRASCDLKKRLNNMRGRIALEGASKTKINNLNNLDVIAEDKRLIEIYTAIVKETAIKNNIA